MTKKTIECYDVSEIQEVMLLSEEEWGKASWLCPLDYSFWWLRDPVGYERAKIVSSSGRTDLVEYIENSWMRVRPAFKINHESKIGNKIIIGKTVCTVVSESIVLADVAVCTHRFDSKTNIYDESEIKSFINSDEFKEML